MQKATRTRVIDYLSKHQAATAAELGRALGMTGANIRHHLHLMETSNLIINIGKSQGALRGRPESKYALSQKAFGSGLCELLEAMIEALLQGMEKNDHDAKLKAIAHRLTGEVQVETNVPITMTMTSAVNRLNQLNYQARWEAGARGPYIIFDNCPYAEIIARYPTLCQMDTYLLENMLTVPVLQTAKMEREAIGLPQCIFEAINV